MCFSIPGLIKNQIITLKIAATAVAQAILIKKLGKKGIHGVGDKITTYYKTYQEDTCYVLNKKFGMVYVVLIKKMITIIEFSEIYFAEYMIILTNSEIKSEKISIGQTKNKRQFAKST